MSKRNGWLPPENVEYPTTCFKMQIPANEAYRAAFWGAITLLQQACNWDTDGDAEKAADIATFWRHLIFDADDGCVE